MKAGQVERWHGKGESEGRTRRGLGRVGRKQGRVYQKQGSGIG